MTISKQLMSKLYRFLGLFCIISVFTMFGMVLSDLVKSEYTFAVTPTSYPPTHVTTDGGFYTNSLIIVGAGKAELSIVIIDINAKPVYQYEKFTISAFGTIFDRNIKLYIPSLTPGIYRMRGILYYSANILMQSKVYIDMGVIVVEESKSNG